MYTHAIEGIRLPIAVWIWNFLNEKFLEKFFHFELYVIPKVLDKPQKSTYF